MNYIVEALLDRSGCNSPVATWEQIWTHTTETLEEAEARAKELQDSKEIVCCAVAIVEWHPGRLQPSAVLHHGSCGQRNVCGGNPTATVIRLSERSVYKAEYPSQHSGYYMADDWRDDLSKVELDPGSGVWFTLTPELSSRKEKVLCWARS